MGVTAVFLFCLPTKSCIMLSVLSKTTIHSIRQGSLSVLGPQNRFSLGVLNRSGYFVDFITYIC